MEFSEKQNIEMLSHLFSIQPSDNSNKISSVKTIFNESGASKATQEAILNYTQKAFVTLSKIEISEEKKKVLRAFGEQLMNRNV